ncbi:hypothetical protein HAX54_002215 [Datura stramonium]|uniref:Uncharacterized protein n=1 Tax=Datura stramonium TaxID=4076 RepID=A0ABS8RSX9_DATST|nr:hypothetical protein [Datura stramonium]
MRTHSLPSGLNEVPAGGPSSHDQSDLAWVQPGSEVGLLPLWYFPYVERSMRVEIPNQLATLSLSLVHWRDVEVKEGPLHAKAL